MVINSFSIRRKDSLKEKVFIFDKSVEYFFSQKNSVGKTTFLRGILYSLGFTIPSTKRINFDNYFFECNITKDDGIDIIVKRHANVVFVGETEYNQQVDFAAIVKSIFNIDNYDLINNLLATIYIDQDKGWTLLNRGKIIGSNSFNIESFIRGLNNKDVISLTSKLKSIEDDIYRYSLMLSVADYQKKLEEHREELTEVTYDAGVEAEIGLLQNKIDNLDKEIRMLNSVKKQNSEFVDYITRLGLQIQIDGKSYIINKNNLLNFNDIQTINDIRLNRLRIERNDLITKRTVLQDRIKQNTLFDSPSVIETFDFSISNAKIDSLQVKTIIDSLNKEKEQIKEQISKATREGNPWIAKLNEYIKQYWQEMEIELEYKDSYLFTRDLKSLSGALLYKIIIVFRLAYMKALFEKTKCCFPILIDSPSGREVKDKIVRKAMLLINRDFNSHQAFVSSIVKYDDIFTLNKDSLLNFDGLNAFDPITIFDEPS